MVVSSDTTTFSWQRLTHVCPDSTRSVGPLLRDNPHGCPRVGSLSVRRVAIGAALPVQRSRHNHTEKLRANQQTRMLASFCAPSANFNVEAARARKHLPRACFPHASQNSKHRLSTSVKSQSCPAALVTAASREPRFARFSDGYGRSRTFIETACKAASFALHHRVLDVQLVLESRARPGARWALHGD
jgi:hypothetical protein